MIDTMCVLVSLWTAGSRTEWSTAKRVMERQSPSCKLSMVVVLAVVDDLGKKVMLVVVVMVLVFLLRW